MHGYLILIAVVSVTVWCQGGPRRRTMIDVPIRPAKGRPVLNYLAPTPARRIVCGRWPSAEG